MADPLDGYAVAPVLRVGERLRLAPGGEVYAVERVSEGAAYLRAQYAAPREVVIRDEVTGKELRRFMAHSGGTVLAVSRRAFVYREGEGA